MKKYHRVIILLTSFFLCACGKSSISNKNVKNFTKLNDLLNIEYSGFSVDVKTQKNNDVLKSHYDIKKKDSDFLVTYRVEEFNPISVNNLPDSHISTKEGTFTKDNYEIDFSNFKVTAKTFTEYEFIENAFAATINNAKDYLKTDYDCLNFEIGISYYDKLSVIAYQYNLSDSTIVSVVYSNFQTK